MAVLKENFNWLTVLHGHKTITIVVSHRKGHNYSIVTKKCSETEACTIGENIWSSRAFYIFKEIITKTLAFHTSVELFEIPMESLACLHKRQHPLI